MMLVICTVIYTGCKKKDNAQPNVSPPVVTGVSNTQNMSTSLNTYPYIDTFTGSFTTYFYEYGRAAPQYSNTDASYEFYVTHIADNQVFVSGKKGIQLEPGGTIYINDSANVISRNLYYGDMHMFEHEGKSRVVKNAITYQVAGNHLSVNWEVSAPLRGACDLGTSIGQFYGLHK